MEEQEEIDQLLHEQAKSLKDRVTKKALQLLQRLGFWGILLFASVRAEHTHNGRLIVLLAPCSSLSPVAVFMVQEEPRLAFS